MHFAIGHIVLVPWIQTSLSLTPEIVLNLSKRIIWAYSFEKKRRWVFTPWACLIKAVVTPYSHTKSGSFAWSQGTEPILKFSFFFYKQGLFFPLKFCNNIIVTSTSIVDRHADFPSGINQTLIKSLEGHSRSAWN